MAWYAGSFRRMLCDMHISDWDPRFLSRFDPEEYVRLLCMARVQTVMLYYQAHTGLCYFPTHSARMHRAFQGREDAMIRTETLCHEAGMSVVGYYSLIFNNWAEETHPEWAMVLADGGTPLQKGMSRYGHCCPNQRGYRAFVSRQLREMLDCFSPEGMFFDMPFWPLPCSCAAGNGGSGKPARPGPGIPGTRRCWRPAAGGWKVLSAVWPRSAEVSGPASP